MKANNKKLYQLLAADAYLSEKLHSEGDGGGMPAGSCFAIPFIEWSREVGAGGRPRAWTLNVDAYMRFDIDMIALHGSSTRQVAVSSGHSK